MATGLAGKPLVLQRVRFARRSRVVALAAAGALVLVALAMLMLAPAPAATDPTVGAFTVLFVIVIAIFAWLTVEWNLADRTKVWILVGCVGIALGVGALIVLNGSPFPPFGLAGDEGFRIASVARSAEHLVPGDFSYRNLPAFFPPLYFVALGRLVALTGISAIEATKLGVSFAALLVPVAAYALWKLTTSDVGLALAVTVAGVALQNWAEPYAWLAVTIFVPWWIHYIDGLLSPSAIPNVQTQRTERTPTAFLAVFDRVTDGLPKGSTVLSTDYRVVDYRPVTLFNVWNPNYAHPAGAFTDRTRFLERLASEADSRVFFAAMRQNRFDSIDAVVLRRAGSELRYEYFDDNFPRGTVMRIISFSASQFPTRYFRSERVPDSDLVVFRSKGSGSALSSSLRRELRRVFPDDVD